MIVTNTSVQALARQLFQCSKKTRTNILEALDTDMRCAVIEEISKLKEDIPLDLRDTTPPGSIPNCSWEG